MAAVHPLDDVAAYAVDALEPGERAALQAHVDACAGCRAELAGHREALAWVVDDEQPPPWLWDQIIADARVRRPPTVRSLRSRAAGGPAAAGGRPARADDPSPAADEPTAGPSAAARRSARGPRHAAVRPLRTRAARPVIAGLAAAAAVVVAVAVGPTVIDSLDDGGGGAPEVAAAELPVGTIEAEDGTTIARVAADDQGSYVEFEGAPAVGPDRDLQLWSVAGPAPVSLGVLGSGESDVRVTLPPDTSAVAISDEPAGGSPQPTGAIVGTGELAVPA